MTALSPRPVAASLAGAAEPDARLKVGRLLEQWHQVMDLDADSVWPVPDVLRAGEPGE
ncbi:hypothetical protein OG552_10180 [Streptomyces sp. NBC_01476]|uniref:hypothetical protein n=1 Tax=Streptomyces sp. NBC_01476 TaxID=2903881 RepID=UPI002E2EC8CC|nr:hypothetical protein [Streptomyces sp. NBC_01476]